MSFKSLAVQKMAQSISDIVLSYRRPFKQETFGRTEYKYLTDLVAQKITPSIKRGQPIPIAIVGFSLKSPSPLKTISAHADRAEFETIEYLKNMTDEISKIYPYGTDFKIFADGRLFVDKIYSATDEKVTKFVTGCKKFFDKIHSANLTFVGIDDFFSGNYQQKRNTLFNEFSIKHTWLNNMIQKDAFFKNYWRFMRDFYAKDIRAISPEKSIKNSKVLGGEIAKEIILASASYDKFINSLYKDPYLRLSVHAKPIYDVEKKIGIFINKLKNPQMPTPWHSVAVKISGGDKGESFVYMKKILAEKMGCSFVPDLDGKGAYFSYPNDNLCSLRLRGSNPATKKGSLATS